MQEVVRVMEHLTMNPNRLSPRQYQMEAVMKNYPPAECSNDAAQSLLRFKIGHGKREPNSCI